jgi:hypothetical protein
MPHNGTQRNHKIMTITILTLNNRKNVTISTLTQHTHKKPDNLHNDTQHNHNICYTLSTMSCIVMIHCVTLKMIQHLSEWHSL